MSSDAKKMQGCVPFKYVDGKPQLDDLWFMVGSRCNLSCAHCYVGSSPTNDNLQQISLPEVLPYLREAKDYGVKHIYFTGGEPFINRDMLAIIEASLQQADVTVLTNAALPIWRFIPKLQELQKNSSYTLSFRVSLDHFEQDKHEAIRGKGNFNRTLDNALKLHEAGFTPIITSTAVVYEDGLNETQAYQGFKKLFAERGVDVEVKLLPYNLEMGTNLDRVAPSKHVFISQDCLAQPNIAMEMFQCHNGRTVEKIQGKMIVYPCPIIYDNRVFELGSTLKESFKPIPLSHKACYDFCYKSGGKCTN